MTDAAQTRVHQLLEQLDDAQRALLASALGVQTSSAVVEALSDLERIRAAANGLSEAGQEGLLTALTMDPAFLDASARGLAEARALGLVFEVSDPVMGARAVIPIEVRTALLERLEGADAPLAVMLADRDLEDLEALAELHAVDLQPQDDAFDAAIAIARALHDIERLHELFETLQPVSRDVLEWLCEVDGPVPADQLSARAVRRGDETASSAVRVLHRLGLVQPFEVDGDALETVPPDTREALRPILETAMSEACREWYQRLRDDATPAFRDQYPSGFGGALAPAARDRVLRVLSGSPLPTDGFDRLLAVLRVLDPEAGVGELASVHLDVSTNDSVARQSLRSWLGSLDDDFTRLLLEPFDGDPTAIAEWILAREAARGPSNAPPSDFADTPEDGDRDAWTTLLFQLRAHLIMALGLLPAGQWFRLSHAARWLTALYRRVVWQYGAIGSFGDEFPRHALPMPGVDVGPQEESAAQEMLFRLFAELFMPLGAVHLDPTGTLFLTNSEALRVFRDGDEGFDLLWSETEDYVGDDIDLWLPLPTEPGVRVSGVGYFGWIDDTTLGTTPATHLFDLVWLADWATPYSDGGGALFVFDEASVSRGLEQHEDEAEEFLLWLRARVGGPIPGRIRSLFPMSSTPADEEDWLPAALGCVDRLIEQLESWIESPPLAVMEEIRSWGDVAGTALTRRLERLIRRNGLGAPCARHLCALLGELGATEATAALVTILRDAPDEAMEGICAMALARIGGAAADPLSTTLENPTADPDLRMVCAGALSAMAVLHPTLTPSIASRFETVIQSLEEPDLATIVAISLAETGAPNSEPVLYALRDQGLWVEEMMPFDEILWIASLSPAVWGHPYFAAPIAHLYPTESESARIRAAAGVEELLAGSGVNEESLLGRTRRSPRGKKGQD